MTSHYMRIYAQLEKAISADLDWCVLDCFMGQTIRTEFTQAVTTRMAEDNNNFIFERIMETKAINAEKDGSSRTIKRQYQQTSKANLTRNDSLGATGVKCNYRIRKFTPRECFRLMGVEEQDIDKLINSGISNSQLYKLAGNSIVVNCLSAIFRQLFIGNKNKVIQTELF